MRTSTARRLKDPDSPARPVRPRPAPRKNRGRALLETHLDLIQRSLRHLSWSGGLPAAEAEELRSWALLKLVDDDYRILGRWKGRSSFPTFLSVVLVNLLRDYRIHLWGKWRPSAASRRGGPTGVLLERLLLRDGLSCAETSERLRAEHGIALSQDEVARLAAAFPRRKERRRAGEDELLQIPVDGQVESRIMERERERATVRLRETLGPLLRSLPADERRLLKLSFFDGLSMASIAPVLGRPQRELYSVRDRCLAKIHRRLTEAGLHADQVGGLLGRLPADLGLEAHLGA
ncbi:MAG TPA: sigma-70 family RNA polymerase sigma factor [Thermoanaerobaculia bacterium]|nr:sigma-70 family RNA polymerase sigma factor [Thermoanaerobaculia bacterium]